MGAARSMLTLEQLQKLSDEQISAQVNERLTPPLGGLLDLGQPADFIAAQFYVGELDRRENRRANAERDRVETRRHRIDLGIDLLIVALIGVEIFLGISAGLQQSRQAAKELKASGDLLAVLSDLQRSSQATAATLEALKGTTESMNEHTKKQLELNYEPSLLVTPAHQSGNDVLEVRNNGRTSITIIGVKARNDVCTLEKPMTISSAVSGFLESSFVLDRTIRRVVTSGGSSPLTIYFRTETGQEFKHEALVNRLPVVEGARVEIQYQNTEPVVWDRELAKLSAGKCPR
jgi:hypothetical protein